MKGNVINLNTLHLNSVRLNGIGKVQSVSLKGGSTEDPVFPPVEPPIEPEPTPTYTLSASVANGVVSATLNGVVVSLPFTANEGDVIVVEVTPNDGYEFNGWNDGNTDNPRTITMNADVALSAQCVEVVQPPVGKYIQFEDAEVERVLMSKGVSSDGVGITIEDAEKVTSISTWFKNNKSISAFTELRFFTNVKTLVDNAFLACSSLKNIDLTNIETMGVRVFGDGGDLSEYDVDMPNLKTLSQGIWNQLFSKTNIRSIVNLGTITKLESAGANASCFGHCVNLQSACLPNTLTEIGAGTFVFCSALTNVDIPSSVVTIGADAFARCKALEELDIPQSIQSIGENAFGFDDNLQKLIVRASVPPSLATDNAFQGCPLITIYVPDASLEAYKTATNWNQFASRIKPLSEYNG